VSVHELLVECGGFGVHHLTRTYVLEEDHKMKKVENHCAVICMFIIIAW